MSLAYSFRYFQDFDEPIRLPQGFEPTRIGVEIHSGKDSSHSFRQAFVWKAQGMSVETEAGGGNVPKGGEMFKRKPNKSANIETLIGAKTRINGDVEFAGGLHLDGYINGNVTGDRGRRGRPVGERAGMHRGFGRCAERRC